MEPSPNHKDPENNMRNMVEVAVTFRILQLLYKDDMQVADVFTECASLKQKISMAILSPHHDQVKCMQQKHETQQQNNEFLKCLWILGDERTHLKGGSIWKSLILDAKARGCFFQADESKDLAKVICEVNEDLRQLDELVRGESTLFQNTSWKVVFSSMFRASFSKIESRETKKLVFLMLLKLSSGWRPRGSSTAASVSESPYFELMKEFKVKGLHLICTVDVMKETHLYTQVIKVWDILPFHEIAGLVRRLDGIIGSYTHEYIDRCKARCVKRGSEYREYPMKWPGTSEISQYKTHANSCDEMFIDSASRIDCIENVKVRESLILMKFYSLSTAAVNTVMYGCDGRDLGIPFELNEQEKNVVSFDKSSFILGRSGTGKTTVLTMKLFQNEQLHHLACEGFHEVMESEGEAKQEGLHQLFVTFSPKLCYAVRQQYGEWKRLTCGGGSSSPSSLTCIEDVDQMMLSEDLLDQFIHLPHDVYPLIITFHRFVLMLDGTVGTSFFARFPNIRHLIYGNKTSTSRLSVLEQFMSFKGVTYERFYAAYWPHFNWWIVIGQKASNGILSRDDYVALCDRRTSIFNAQKREIIYSIFLQYENIKVENGNFDLADIVNDLHQRLEVEGYAGDMMDYVFVDEVQDLSMRQIMLFKYVCTNVHEGFAFSGDTAQAIAKGIGFRFEDIRCLFYKKFLSGSKKGTISTIFQLSENFRTHAGVLNMAQSVINLLCHFFPLFVDELRPESGRIGGELPILLETDMNKNAISLIFQRNESCSQFITGFGAEQVVLVRDESLREKVVKIVGKKALVLTIMESKGLEFQDVLLYDFFTTSSFSNEWRIIYSYMKDKDMLNAPFTTMCSCFDMDKHAVLCSELKLLYVAITRTRQRLWICESAGFSEPIYDYWKTLNLVEVKHLSDSFADKMQSPSGKDEWKSRGVKLFCENNFRMAQMCFLKAGDKYSKKLAEAYHLREIGWNARASHPERKKLLQDAAELFSSIGKNKLAAECYYEIEDYIKAGCIYRSESMLEKAGDCFCLARCYERAVEEYEKAGAFAQCFSACTKGKLFERGFEQLHRWGECGDARLKFLCKGAHYYFLINDSESMMKFVRSFYEKSEIRRFLIK
ncbi:hypothetical protein QVD17_05199 [Tagetes erecta]|uniref:UvrD-like helicase ATP-binding domain-containing protein n=1 Tax=Tagetes erecta TaxID=13708 RepID=A0AAD8PBA4_TARER|nr:hypothetical protein QVD17_05199 [Tagetes erecta]